MARISKYFAAMPALALTMAIPALADVKAGVDAWSRGDYAMAIREWQPLAARGDADAQFNLAQAYKLGRGVPADLTKAEALFAQAAARGHLQAADNLGLLLFQRGERARAMPLISAAAARGDPRAQYLLGLAHFNADIVEKDWVRAYALVSLAQQGGLAQAVPALAQMDQYIPLEQRQQSVALAAKLASAAEATRQQQFATADLGVGSGPAPGSRPDAVVAAATIAGRDSPGQAGADFTRPRPQPQRPPQVADILDEGSAGTPASAPVVTARTARPAPPVAVAQPRAVPPARPAPAPAPASGNWRVQLGAFGVPGNADALWARVKGRPELAGHARINLTEGRLTRLQAGGFASQADAQAACSRLQAGGFTCIALRN